MEMVVSGACAGKSFAANIVFQKNFGITFSRPEKAFIKVE